MNFINNTHSKLKVNLYKKFLAFGGFFFVTGLALIFKAINIIFYLYNMMLFIKLFALAIINNSFILIKTWVKNLVERHEWYKNADKVTYNEYLSKRFKICRFNNLSNSYQDKATWNKTFNLIGSNYSDGVISFDQKRNIISETRIFKVICGHYIAAFYDEESSRCIISPLTTKDKPVIVLPYNPIIVNKAETISVFEGQRMVKHSYDVNKALNNRLVEIPSNDKFYCKFYDKDQLEFFKRTGTLSVFNKNENNDFFLFSDTSSSRLVGNCNNGNVTNTNDFIIVPYIEAVFNTTKDLITLNKFHPKNNNEL